MRRLANVVLPILALAFCLAALPVVSAAQEVTAGHGGRSASLSGQTLVTPSPKLATPATAIPEGTTVVYSNFGPGYTYYSGDWWVETGADQDFWYPFTQAMSFIPAQGSYQLTQLDLALGYWGVGTNALFVDLCGEGRDGLPGPVLFSAYVSNLPTIGTTGNTVQTIKVSQPVTLLKGLRYYLVAVPYANEAAGWNFNLVGAESPGAYLADGGDIWYPYEYAPNGAFDVLGTVLPPG